MGWVGGVAIEAFVRGVRPRTLRCGKVILGEDRKESTNTRPVVGKDTVILVRQHDKER